MNPLRIEELNVICDITEEVIRNLHSTRIPIAEIAGQSGVAIPAHFSQVITRASEPSPGISRKSID